MFSSLPFVKEKLSSGGDLATAGKKEMIDLLPSMQEIELEHYQIMRFRLSKSEYIQV